MRHAGAGAVSIAVTREAAYTVLTVTDDGNGLAVMDGSGSGIHGMIERAAAAGGSLKLFSVPGRGTRVVARLPAKMGVHPHTAQDPLRAD